MKKSTIDRFILSALRAGFGVASRVSPRAAGKAGELLFRRPRAHSRPRRERDWLIGGERRSVDSGANRLAVWSWGTGPVVLLVHGWEARGSQLGAFVQPLTRAGFRVVAYDAPAHGDSDGTLSSLPQFADAAQRVAESVGGVDAAIAHSFGVAALCAAMLDGLEVDRPVFISPPADFQGYFHEFGRIVGMSELALNEMIASLERRFGLDWEITRRVTLAAADEREVLVVHDRDDEETPLLGARQVAAAWPSSELLLTDGLGHRRILRDAGVIQEVVDFLSARSRPPEPARLREGSPPALRTDRRGGASGTPTAAHPPVRPRWRVPAPTR